MKFIKQPSDLTMICMSVIAAAAIGASAWAGPGSHQDGRKGCNQAGNCPMMSGDKTANSSATDKALALAFTTQDGMSRQGQEQEITQVISSKIQDRVGNVHSVIIKRTVDDGKESIVLTIDGKNYRVDSMDEANKILEDNGITGLTQMDMPDMPDAPMFGQPGHPNGNHQPNDKRHRAIQRPRAMLGVSLAPVNPAVRSYLGIEDGVGVMVAAVVPDTPAEESGLKGNDLITGIAINNNTHTVNEQSFRKIIAQQQPGSEVDLQVLRAGRAITISVKLAKWDADKLGVRFEQEPRLIRGLHPDQFNNMPNNMMKDMPKGKMKCNPDMMKGVHKGKMNCNPDMMKGMGNNMPGNMMNGMPGNMPHDMMRGMPHGIMKDMPGNMMEGMHQFRLQLDPDNGTWKWLDENGNQDQDNDGDSGNMHHRNQNDNDQNFRNQPDMNRMMQMMNQRMRRFQRQMEKMLKQQNQMQNQLNKQQHSKDGIDT